MALRRTVLLHYRTRYISASYTARKGWQTLKTGALLIALVAATATPAHAQSFGIPNTSNKPPSGSPIQIEDCKAGQDGGLLIAQSDGRFEIAFSNEGGTAADLIRFQVDLDQERFFIRDAGKFSPGITIRHRYRQRGGNVVSSPLLRPAKMHCEVLAVHFVDGTSWTPSSVDASDPKAEPAEALRIGGYLGIVFKQRTDGVYAGLILPASPAQKADIRQGDRITALESNQIQSTDDLMQLLNATPPGTKLRITLLRNGRVLSVVVKLGRRPQ